MNSPSAWRIAIVFVIFCVSIGSAADKPTDVVFSDAFKGRLKDGWSWVRESPGAWKADKQGLRMLTSPGGLWEKANNNRNVLLRSLPKEAGKTVAVEVHVETAPKRPFEHGGLIWRYDDDNWVYLVKEQFEGKPHILIVGEKQGSPRKAGRYFKQPVTGKGVWLRLECTGSQIVGKYREAANAEWKILGAYKPPSNGPANVGLTTGYGDAKSKRISTFRDFRILKLTNGK